jgi:hypothetical protein
LTSFYEVYLREDKQNKAGSIGTSEAIYWPLLAAPSEFTHYDNGLLSPIGSGVALQYTITQVRSLGKRVPGSSSFVGPVMSIRTRRVRSRSRG